MGWRISVAVLMACWLAGRGLAQQTPPATQSSVDALVAQLGSEDWKVRDEAQSKLVKMGMGALPRLEELLKQSQDPQVRSRIETIGKRIAADDHTSPTLITLHVKNANPIEVFQEISKQARAPINAWPEWTWRNLKGKVTIDADRQPFWVVMQSACNQAGVRPMNHKAEITLMQESQGWPKRPESVNGGYLFLAESAGRSHSIDFSNPGKTNTSFNITITGLIDPKFNVIQNSGLNLTEAVDEKGNSLRPMGRLFGGSNEYWRSPSFGAGWTWTFTANLNYLPQGGKRIASLKGMTKFRTITQVETWEIENVLAAKEATKATPLCKYTLHGITKQGQNEYQLRLTLEPTKHAWFERGNNPLTDHSMLNRSMHVVDAAGRPLSWGGSSGSGSENRMEYTINMRMTDEQGQPVGEPAKIVWDLPLELQEAKVPFEFKDLPIP